MIKSSSAKANKPGVILELKNITKTYGQQENLFHALTGVNLKIYESDFVSITGPSGSGKSTLMHLIGLLDNPTSGQILLNQKDISQLKEHQLAQLRNQTLGFVFQQFNLLPKTTALDNVTLPLLYSDIPKSQWHSLAVTMLTKVGLQDKLKNTPAQLSGGQQQRVAIARALITNPKIILADEPTGNLDSKSGTEVLNIFKRLHSQEKRTIVFVTHDPDLAREAQRIIVIKDGQIV